MVVAPSLLRGGACAAPSAAPATGPKAPRAALDIRSMAPRAAFDYLMLRVLVRAEDNFLVVSGLRATPRRVATHRQGPSPDLPLEPNDQMSAESSPWDSGYRQVPKVPWTQ